MSSFNVVDHYFFFKKRRRAFNIRGREPNQDDLAFVSRENFGGAINGMVHNFCC